VYNEHDRPSTQRIILTLAAVVGAIAAVVVVGAVVFGALAPRPNQTSSAVAPLSAVPTASTEPSVPAPASVVASVTAETTPAPLAVSGVVVVEAGHQARGDSSLEPEGPGSTVKKPRVADGATGVATHKSESQTNLAVALKLQTALEARGVTVKMVRTSDDVNIANSERAAVGNDAQAALFIRLHSDGVDNSSTRGISTLVPAKNKWTAPIVAQSAVAGRLIHKSVVSATGATDRGVVTRSDLSGFNWSEVPTVLVEMGFMSNPAEDRQLNSAAYQQKLADGMAEGAIQYLQSR
jgi:N-acetylmuramoyl-L-alanine amidase